MNRLLSLLANLAWLASCLPSTLAFLAALAWPEASQRRLLRRMLADPARHTLWAERGRFERADGRGLPSVAPGRLRIPPALRVRDPGGRARRARRRACHRVAADERNGAAPKLIPFTRGLQRQCQAALDPWMASLFVRRPRLLLGRQYWCVSPNTRPRPEAGSAVPAGFAADTDYLGGWQYAGSPGICSWLPTN